MANRFSASQKQKVDIADHPLVQQIDAANRRKVLKPKQKDIGKKILVVTSILLLVGFGIYTYLTLAKIEENHTKSVTTTNTTVSTLQTNDTKKSTSSASSPSKENVTNNLASTPALNKQTIIITGDHLKNGIISSASQPYPIDKNANNKQRDNKPNTDISPIETNTPINHDTALANENNTLQSDKAIDNQAPKSTVSYEEFVKASETTIYRDNSPSKK